MNFPSISHYAVSADNPHGMFRTIRATDCLRDMYDRPKIIAGNNAAIFIIDTPEGKLQLKCYIRFDPERESVYRYIEDNPDPLLACARWHREELLVFDDLGSGHYLDVVTSPWIEGRTLSAVVHEAVRETDLPKLRNLSEAFDILARELLSREWAHGDLKPDNIIVTEEGTLRLIDYDSLIFPGREGTYTELGTPGYRHPDRHKFSPDKTFDDYSIAVIGSSLRAIALDPALYRKYSDGDCLLFTPEDIMSGTSKAYLRACDLLARSGDFTGLCLSQSLLTPNPSIPILRSLLRPEPVPAQVPDKPEIMSHGNRWGYMTEEGTVFIPPVFEDAGNFHEGLAVAKLNGRILILRVDGTYIMTDEKIKEAKYFSESLCAVRIDDLWGFTGPDGGMVIRPEYDCVRSFHEGLAAVSKGGKFGYIDLRGRVVTKPVYDRAGSFRNGKAIVHSDGVMHVLDRRDIPF